MNQHDTARRLKRIPFDEMSKLAQAAINDTFGIPPVYTLGHITVERNEFYNPSVLRHCQLSRALELGNWTFEEYGIEMEKRAIIEQIDRFNDSLEFPDHILKRAKRFFPDMKFTPAKLELE